MRKIITFLGIKPRETLYLYEGKEYAGRVFAEALRQFLDFDEMLVFTTAEAYQTAYPLLEALNDKRLRPVSIPKGEDENELWMLFDRLTQEVQNGDTVIFDITHGLRSIPFLVFLAAAYLKEARDVTIERIYYGAFEMGQPAPVIDLSGFISLLDWLTATNQFFYTGNARYLAHLLEEHQQPALNQLASTVEEIALGLHLLRPNQVSEAASRLPDDLHAAQQLLPAPFTLLSDRLLLGYGQFGQSPADEQRHLLQHQLEMINWYHKAGQIVHTLSLGREWVVSLLCVHFDADIQDKEEREELELLLSGGKIKDSTTGEVLRASKYLDHWNTVPEGKRLRKLWNRLANLRNDVLHSGFRKSPGTAQEIICLAREIVQELNAIAEEIGILQPAGPQSPTPNTEEP